MAKALHFQVCLRIVAPHTSCARIPQTWDRTPYWNSWAAPIQIPRQGRRSIPSNRPSLTGQRVCISTMYWCIYGSKIIIIYNRWTHIYIYTQTKTDMIYKTKYCPWLLNQNPFQHLVAQGDGGIFIKANRCTRTPVGGSSIYGCPRSTLDGKKW